LPPWIPFLADYGVESYDIGTGFGHFGIAVEDVSLYFYESSSFNLLAFSYAMPIFLFSSASHVA
jgi:hypothetical protein